MCICLARGGVGVGGVGGEWVSGLQDCVLVAVLCCGWCGGRVGGLLGPRSGRVGGDMSV